MVALFRKTQVAQRTAFVGSASATFVQANSAVLAAILLILFPLTEKCHGNRILSPLYSLLPSTTNATPPTVMAVPSTSQRLTFSCCGRNSPASISVNSGLADTMGEITTTGACCSAK